MKTIIYIRTSTDEQNPENQLKDCQSICNGEFEVVEDRQSAWKEHQEREGFSKIRKMILSGQINKLIVWDLDRIYRNRKNLVEFFKLCEINKCQISSYRQKWMNQISEMPSPWNEIIYDLMIQIMGWLAQDESDKKSQRVKASIRIKEDGVYSYKGNRWGRKPVSKNVIKKVLELKDKLSIREIVKHPEVYYWDKNNNKKPLGKSTVHKIITENKGEIKS